MITIHKYALEKQGLNLIPMHANALALHVGMQDSSPFIWMRVDTDERMRERGLWLFGTGRDLSAMPFSCPHIGTVQAADSLVWHIFDGGYAPNA